MKKRSLKNIFLKEDVLRPGDEAYWDGAGADEYAQMVEVVKELGDDIVLVKSLEHGDQFEVFKDELDFSGGEEDYDDYDDDMDGDFDSAMASAGLGTDEDYGFYGEAKNDKLLEKQYVVVLQNILWDREEEPGAFYPGKLPDSMTVYVRAYNEDEALYNALDKASDETGFLIQGSDPTITLNEAPDDALRLPVRPPSKKTKENYYEVFFYDIQWPLDIWEPTVEPDDLPDESFVIVKATDEQNAHEAALDLIEKKFGVAFHGYKLEVELITRLESYMKKYINTPTPLVHGRTKDIFAARSFEESAKRKGLSLKEVFLKEEHTTDSRYMESIKTQMKTHDPKKVASAHDEIVELLKKNKTVEDPEFKSLDPFTKFHFRIAKRDLKKGTLNLSSLPSGKDMLGPELERRKTIKKYYHRPYYDEELYPQPTGRS